MKIFLFVLLLFSNLLANNSNENNSTQLVTVINEVTDTLKVVSSIHETDTIFLYLLFKMNEGFQSIGLYFEFYGLDTAKLVFIIFILGSSWILRYLISNLIEWKFASKDKGIKKSASGNNKDDKDNQNKDDSDNNKDNKDDKHSQNENNSDNNKDNNDNQNKNDSDKNDKKPEDLVYKLVESIKIPLLWFLIVWSIHWSVKVFYYPEIINEILESLFSTIQLLTGVWLVWNVLSNYKEIILSKKKDLKIEEVDLILISLKILLIIVSGLIIIYTYWPDILKYVGGAGLVIGLFMKDSFSSYLAAFKLVTDKDFSIGDWIKYSKGEGTIIGIGLFYTKIRAFDQSLLLVPNSELITDSVINYDKRIVRRIKFNFYLPINIKSSKIRIIIDEIRCMIENHKGISYQSVLSYDKDEDSKRRRERGFSDTVFVHLLDVEHGNMINVYAFTKKDDWRFQRDTQEDIILKIKEILEKNECSMIIEAKYLQNPLEENIELQKSVNSKK